MIVTSHKITMFVSHTQSNDFRKSQASGVLKINPSQKLKFEADISFSSGGNATWSVDDSSVNLQQPSLSAVQTMLLMLPAASVGHVHTLYDTLVLPPASLLEASTFVFTLSCILDNGFSNFAIISISTNSPPLPGKYTMNELEDLDINFLLFQYELSPGKD
jgi:hypothetical protein